MQIDWFGDWFDEPYGRDEYVDDQDEYGGCVDDQDGRDGHCILHEHDDECEYDEKELRPVLWTMEQVVR